MKVVLGIIIGAFLMGGAAYGGETVRCIAGPMDGDGKTYWGDWYKGAFSCWNAKGSAVATCEYYTGKSCGWIDCEDRLGIRRACR